MLMPNIGGGKGGGGEEQQQKPVVCDWRNFLVVGEGDRVEILTLVLQLDPSSLTSVLLQCLLESAELRAKCRDLSMWN